MNKYYREEIDRLGDVYAAAVSSDVSELTSLVEAMGSAPLTVVGSGGSFSTAAFAAQMHEYYTGQVGRAVTPLEYLHGPGATGNVLCMSASGRNKDIGLAFKRAAHLEAGVVGALVMSRETPLHALQRRHAYTRIATVTDQLFQDGFLAVASLLASCLTLVRAYEIAFKGSLKVPGSLDALGQESLGEDGFSDVNKRAGRVSGLETTCLLYAPVAKPTALDLESRFVEAALGNLHISDLRNFGHGRHNWLAKRGNNTGVIAIVSAELADLKDRTLGLLPGHVPAESFVVSGSPPLQSLASMIVGLHISDATGRIVGVDPGKPSIPQFGRRLYRLGPGLGRTGQRELNRTAALARKAPRSELLDSGKRQEWVAAHEDALQRFNSAKFSGIVLDYDGTLCEPEKRFKPLDDNVGEALTRLLSEGAVLGVATGRGPSAGIELRQVLPESYWPKFLTGYYNGGIVTNLADERDPIAAPVDDDDLFLAIAGHELFAKSELRANECQISIWIEPELSVDAAAALVRELSDGLQRNVRILTSGHSLDIVPMSSRKTAVIEAVAACGRGEGPVLRIGDKGAWPGNDADLLDSPYGLSVDTVSRHRDRCWNLAPAGLKGLQATLYYLSTLTAQPDGLRMKLRPGDKGVRDAC